MKAIDADKLKANIIRYLRKMIFIDSRTETHINANIVRAIDINTLNDIIDKQDEVDHDCVLEETQRERDAAVDRYMELNLYVKNNCIRKDILLDDMREIIDDFNDNNLHMTNDQLYDVLKREVESPLYDRPDSGDSDNS